MVTDQLDERSSVRVNRKKELVNVRKNEIGKTMIGISYILKEEADSLIERIRELVSRKEYDQSFWELALLNKDRMFVAPKEIEHNKVHEINTYEQNFSHPIGLLPYTTNTILAQKTDFFHTRYRMEQYMYFPIYSSLDTMNEDYF